MISQRLIEWLLAFNNNFIDQKKKSHKKNVLPNSSNVRLISIKLIFLPAKQVYYTPVTKTLYKPYISQQENVSLKALVAAETKEDFRMSIFRCL